MNVNSSFYYPKQSQGEINDNVFNNYGVAKFNSTGHNNTQQLNFNREYDGLSSQNNYTNEDYYEDNSGTNTKKPYIYYTENTNYTLQQKMKSKSNFFNHLDLTPNNTNYINYETNNYSSSVSLISSFKSLYNFLFINFYLIYYIS